MEWYEDTNILKTVWFIHKVSKDRLLRVPIVAKNHVERCCWFTGAAVSLLLTECSLVYQVMLSGVHGPLTLIKRWLGLEGPNAPGFKGH